VTVEISDLVFQRDSRAEWNESWC